MIQRIHVGTMGWSYNFWVNNFYSKNTRPESFLEEYSKTFETVEVNSTFYRVPSVSVLKKWRTQTDSNFTFSVKAPKKVTHSKSIKENLDYLDYFLENIATLKSKLGPILFQFPYSFKFQSFDELKNLVSVLPKSYRYAIEIRNKIWLDDRFYLFLKDNNICLVFNDIPWLKIDEITADFVYFRLEGNRKKIDGTKGIIEQDKTKEIEDLAKKIRSHEEGIECFVYFSKYFSGHSPSDAKKLLTLIHKGRFKEK